MGAKRNMGGFGEFVLPESFCVGIQALMLLLVGPFAFKAWMMILVSREMKDIIEMKNQFRRIAWHCIPLSIICLLVGTLLAVISPVGAVIFLLLGAWLLVNGVRYLRKYRLARETQMSYWDSGYARVRRDKGDNK